MKLRFRKNSVRLRINQREAQDLADGRQILETVYFPGGSRLLYSLQAENSQSFTASFQNGDLKVTLPRQDTKAWVASDDIGLYFEAATPGPMLQVAIEKDLECVDGPAEERDPDAFKRQANAAC